MRLIMRSSPVLLSRRALIVILNYLSYSVRYAELYIAVKMRLYHHNQKIMATAGVRLNSHSRWTFPPSIDMGLDADFLIWDVPAIQLLLLRHSVGSSKGHLPYIVPCSLDTSQFSLSSRLYLLCFALQTHLCFTFTLVVEPQATPMDADYLICGFPAIHEILADQRWF